MMKRRLLLGFFLLQTVTASAQDPIEPLASGVRPRIVRQLPREVPKSSEQVIDAAVAAGRIDSQTGLVYKVLATFDDCRLPAEYRGDDRNVTDTNILLIVSEQVAGFTPENRAIVEPYLRPPNEENSWFYRRSLACPESLPTFEPAIPVWTAEQTADGRARIWHSDQKPEDFAIALRIMAAWDYVWPTLTTLMKRPLIRDANNPLSIFLAPINEKGVGGARGGPGCNKELFLTINTSHPEQDQLSDERKILSTFAHELMHVITATYTADICGEYRWLDEATAKWAEDYVYPRLNLEHDWARIFLSFPEEPLEIADQKGEPYPAYLFLFYLSHLYNDDIIREIWEAAGGSQVGLPDSLMALNVAINKYRAGGLTEEWHQFALYNLNQEPYPYPYYKNWDGLNTPVHMIHYVSSVGTPVPLEGRSPRGTRLDHLSAQYHAFHFSEKMRSIAFVNGLTFAAGTDDIQLSEGVNFLQAYTSDPIDQELTEGVKIQALVKLEGKTTWEVEDWTERPFVTFCRDRTKERIEKLVIIFSNGQFKSRTKTAAPQADPALLKTSAMGCSKWVGTSSYNGTLTDLNSETTTATIEWHRDDSAAEPRPDEDDPRPDRKYLWGFRYKPQGKVTSRMWGKPLVFNCTFDISGETTPDPESSYLYTLNFVPNVDDEGVYTGEGSGHPILGFMSCPTGPVPLELPPTWFDITIGPRQKVSEDGQILKGSRSASIPGASLQHQWDFRSEPE